MRHGEINRKWERQEGERKREKELTERVKEGYKYKETGTERERETETETETDRYREKIIYLDEIRGKDPNPSLEPPLPPAVLHLAQ